MKRKGINSVFIAVFMRKHFTDGSLSEAVIHNEYVFGGDIEFQPS